MDRIRAMQLFLRLAERGSFSAAARDLKIKQSTASKWVAALEEELSVRLVDRTTRALHLTEAGMRFHGHARYLLGVFDDMVEDLRKRSPEPQGKVRVSVPEVFGRRFVVEPVMAFLREHRRVEVDLALDDRYVNLVDEAFDLAVRVGVPEDTSAQGRKLVDTRRRLVGSPAYLAERGVPKAIPDLILHECLLHDTSGYDIWRFRLPEGPELSVRAQGRAAANSSEAILMMARAGFGLALLADWLVAEDIESGALIPLLDDLEAPPAPVWLLTPSRRFTPAAVRALSDHLAATIPEALAAVSAR